MKTLSSDRLFQADKDWENNACLNFAPDQWDVYAEGYILAADTLVNHVVSTKANQDTLVYPIVFLYRQFIELRLKHIVILGAKLSGTVITLPTHHQIDKTWTDVRNIIVNTWPATAKSDLVEIENLIKEFSKIDRLSMVFRYPVDTKKKPSLPRGMRHINLRRLRDLMREVSQLLDAVALGMDQILKP